MDLKVTQENLSKALSSVARVASGRSTLPILSNVLLQTVNNRLRISATNLDIGITHYIGSKISKEGSLTIPARLAQDFVSNLPSSTIHLKQDAHKLNIDAETYKAVINGVAADEFPVMPDIQNGRTISLPSNQFKKALQQVIFAASADETRPVLTGVFFHTQGGNLYITATDSYRLAEKKVDTIKQEVKVLVPATALQDLLRIIGDTNEPLEITHDDQQVLFKFGDIELIARLIEGNYPEYQRLIPAEFSTTATINRDEFISITKVSSLFSKENAGSITVSVDEKTKQLSIQSIASQVGENQASAQGEVVGSGEITLNSRYLLEGLQAHTGEKVTFCFNGKLESIVLKNPDNDDYIHLIMPLKS